MLSQLIYFVNKSLKLSKNASFFWPFFTLVLPICILIGAGSCTLRYQTGQLDGSVTPSESAASPGSNNLSRHHGDLRIGPDDVSVSRPENGFKLRAPDAKSYAMPISPSVIEEFPNLLGFEGHLLLGNGLVQVVIAGAGSSVKSRPEQDLILAFFERRGSIFFQINAIQRVTAMREKVGRTSTEPGLSATAVDTGSNETDAWVRIVFGGAGQKGSQQWRLWLAGSSRSLNASWEIATAKLDEVDKERTSAASMSSHAALTPWALRIYSGKSGRILLPPEAPETAAKPLQKPKQKYHSYVRAHDVDVIGVIATSPFFAELSDQIDELTSIEKPSPGETVEFVIGSAASSSLLVRAEARSRCLNTSDGGSTKAGVAQAVACVTQFPTTSADVRVWRNEASSGNNVSRAALIKNGNDQIVGYTVLGDAKQPIITQLPGNQTYKIQSVWHKFSDGNAIDVQRNQTGILETPPIEQGTAFVALASDGGIQPGWDFPAIATLRSLDYEPWIGLNSLMTTGTMLESGKVLVTRWPVKFELPIGRYELEVARAPYYCRQVIEIAAREVKQELCTLRQMKYQEGSENMPPFYQADFSTVADEFSSYVLSSASGSSTLVREVGVEKNSATPKEHSRLISAILEKGLGNGFRLAALPVDAEMLALWKTMRKDESREKPLMLRDFVRKYHSETLTVLSCPGLGTVLDDYAALLEKLAPDAAQLFGCFENSAIERNFLQVAMEYSSHAVTPLILLPSGVQNSRIDSAWIPRLQIDKNAELTNVALSPQSLITKLRHGDYRISGGMQIGYRFEKAKGRGKPEGVNLTWNTYGEVKPRVVVVYENNQDPILQMIPPDIGHSLFIPLLRKSRLVRFEIRGDDHVNIRGGSADYVLLGSTPILVRPGDLGKKQAQN